MNGRLVALVAALLFLAAAIGFGVRSWLDRPPGAASVDVEFLQDMIRHHEQAQELSNVELQVGGEEAAKTFAREILLFQSYEIGLMERQLEQWGYRRGEGGDHTMPGMASDEELDALADARGRDADALFLALMRDHHLGGVQMASYASTHADSGYVRALAKRMAENQRLEITEMELAQRNGRFPPNPPGYDPANFDDAKPAEGSSDDDGHDH